MLMWTVWEIVLERFFRFGETIKENLIFWETRWLSWPIYWTFKKNKMSLIHLNMSPRHFNMSLRHFAWKNAKMSLNHLNTFPRHLNMARKHLAWKNAKLSLRYFHVSLRHLNIPLRHLAGKKTRCLPQISKRLSGISPVKKSLPNIWTCLSNISLEKCQGVSKTS